MTERKEPDRGDASRSLTIQSVERTAEVLRELSSKPKGATALELAGALQLERSTVHRILRTLLAVGLAERRGTAYCLGPACAQLGAGRLQTLGLREIALPFAVDLQRSFVKDRPAIVSISVRAMDEVIIVDRVWTPAVPLSILTNIGWRFRIDDSVSGRAMLSTLDDVDIVSLIGPQRHSALRQRLREIRKRGGLEFGLGERHPGVGTVAVPVTMEDGIAVGALIVAGLGLESELDDGSPLAHEVRGAAAAISQQLRSRR